MFQREEVIVLETKNKSFERKKLLEWKVTWLLGDLVTWREANRLLEEKLLVTWRKLCATWDT